MATEQVSIPGDGQTKRKWQDIARELSQEQDHGKVIALSHELNDAMLEDERLKTHQRIGSLPSKPI